MQTLKLATRTVLEQVLESSHDCPNSTALSHGNKHLSYGELDRRSSQFAAYLLQLGVDSGCTVAICMERSIDWIVAALGIMRAGAAYVPLDSSWPDSRLLYTVNDSGASVLVARETLLARLNVGVYGIDPCRDAAAINETPEVQCLPVQANSLAYVIYTSGSTGVPKGVEITHANLAHLAKWHISAFDVTRQDRASHLAGLGFDAAVWELWPNLAAGATVCIAEDVVRSSPYLIQQWMIRDGITIGFVPTVHAGPITALKWPNDVALRVLLTGGDVLHHAPRSPLPFTLINNYGPTECAVVATSSSIQVNSEAVPPIGRPILGAQIYLLDDNGEQVPDGTPGEIFIGGEGVGRGYRNLPEATDRCFLPDPFAERPNARMYRTGDRGFRRADGEIEFRGRLDRQTKIRGQRVELDEIGSILIRHPKVNFATATAFLSEGGENQLVAYVLPEEEKHAPSATELQEHLLQNLPDYMIPSTFVRLDAVPLSSNGKIDLSKLAPPSRSNQLGKNITREPKTVVEQTLLSMLREVLDDPTVSVEDNFFLKGGHSLLSMQLVMRMRAAFGVDLAPRQLFETPTVEALAVVIEAKSEGQRLNRIWAELLDRKQFGMDDNFFDLGGNANLLIILQQRLVEEFQQHIPTTELFFHPTIRRQTELLQSRGKRDAVLPPGVFTLHPTGTRKKIFWIHSLTLDLAKTIGDDQPFVFVTFTASDLEMLGETPALNIIAECLVRKILATQPKGPYNLGGLCVGSVLAFEIASQLRAAGHEVSLLVLLDAPTQPYLKSCDSLAAKLRHPLYIWERASRLGLKKNIVNLRKRLLKKFPRHVRERFAETEVSIAHELVESAAFAYYPQTYKGKVLLILARERASHLNFLPGWVSIVPNLHSYYVEGYHRELINAQNIGTIASLIASHLTPPEEERPVVQLSVTPSNQYACMAN